ncbi:NAD(P)-binding protein [Hanseniaspora valbyensis NRRL Y-1626]|uniref:NAD(P)-binding protein n=1 Tax=Hanseniaspora valbyensis NRRL Y-1626 TaxID=766949 RepID=A0A1B7TCC0_9ASCO|nr:NAD(P)-binding protein [Hanseniaspora valbyensis NRRL Y-1626]
MSTKKQTVFLSGASGFIAQQIVKQLLDSKKFKVIGSVRSEEKANSLAENFKSPDLSFVYVKELADPTAFDEAFKEHGFEIDYVIHSASPVVFTADDVEKEIIIPAKNGSNVVFSESSWNPVTFEEGVNVDGCAYFYAKKSAEELVWKLAKENKVKFGVTSVCPSYVFGPQAFDVTAKKDVNFSAGIVTNYIKTTVNDSVGTGYYGFCIDVRDVARAHIEPLLNSEKFNDQRLYMVTGTYGEQYIVDTLNTIPELKGKIAVGTPHGDDDIQNRIAKCDNSKTRELLGFEFISVKQSIIDTAQQVLRASK